MFSRHEGSASNVKKDKRSVRSRKLYPACRYGYYDSEDIVACEEDGITCLVPKRPSGAKKADGFNHDDFKYDNGKNCYICPCGQELNLQRYIRKNHGREYQVYSNTPACTKCLRRLECTKHKYREMCRLPCQNIIDRVDERTRKNKKLYHKRQEIVEHPFGTIKAIWGYKQFLCRTKKKVTAEVALSYLAYNMCRFYNITAKNKAKQVT